MASFVILVLYIYFLATFNIFDIFFTLGPKSRTNHSVRPIAIVFAYYNPSLLSMFIQIWMVLLSKLHSIFEVAHISCKFRVKNSFLRFTQKLTTSQKISFMTNMFCLKFYVFWCMFDLCTPNNKKFQFWSVTCLTDLS